MTSNRRTTYEKAVELLAAADARHGRASACIEYSAKDRRPAYLQRWNTERVAAWKSANAIACQAARDAVAASPAVAKADALADKALANNEDNRSVAKACAARYAMRQAIFVEAYGRAMPKEFHAK